MRRAVLSVLWLCVGCGAPQALGAGAEAPTQAPGGGRMIAASSPHGPRVTPRPDGRDLHDIPDRDPAARGHLAVDLSSADLPDDRDGDGIDQLDLCPELLPDRVDGCPRAR